MMASPDHAHPLSVALDLGAEPALEIGKGGSVSRLVFSDWPALVQLQKGKLPRPAEIERQIEVVEDWLMPLLRMHLPQRSDSQSLFCDAAFLNRLHLGSASNAALGIAEIERSFNELADIAAGHPAAHSRLPLDADFTARLVLLREVMHHGGFAVASPRIHPA
jgi:hypothetical protein